MPSSLRISTAPGTSLSGAGLPVWAACLSLMALAGCGQGAQQAQPTPPQVAYITITEQPVTLSTVLPARTSAYETSDVRPQVDGLILARLFQEGDDVKAGQPLYRIDPAPYQAQAANARAALANARAQIAATAGLARRYGELVKINAVAVQDFENAQASAQQAQASVAAQEATLRNATINLERTTIRAPIAGRIGRSTITTGALVSAGQTSALTTIQRLDPIFVDVQQSSADLLRLRQEMLSGQIATSDGIAHVRLTLEDGSVYPQTGTFQFADVTVDPSTGSQAIRAKFPNPQRLLLPGMFVRAEVVEGTRTKAILIPQQAVTRDTRGQATVFVIGADNKLQARTLQAPRTVGTNWLVTGGVKPGERVVVEGPPTLQPGASVTPVPKQEGGDAKAPALKPGAPKPSASPSTQAK